MKTAVCAVGVGYVLSWVGYVVGAVADLNCSHPAVTHLDSTRPNAEVLVFTGGWNGEQIHDLDIKTL